jgi:TP901 family phage tail tape measure protein
MATQFKIDVVVDPTRANRGVGQVEKGLARTSASAQRLGRTITTALGAVGVALGGRAVISLLSDFSQEMSTVRAVAGATDAQFAELNATAQELGVTTRFAAREAAQGMVALARSGFDTNEVLAATRDTLLLAQAGALDLGTAAEITAGTLGGFRLEAAEAGRVADVLASASNSALTTVFELGDALKFVGPVAAGLNVSLEETTAAVSALADANLRGSLGGTGLRRVLAELESPSTKTAKIFRSLGIETEQVNVSTVGLTQALRVLRAAGVDAGQGLEIFGQRGGPAFEVLVNNIPKVEELTQQFADAGGTAERIAEIMDDNLQGSLLALRSAIEGLIISTGDQGLTGSLRTLVDFFTDVFRTLGGANEEFKTSETTVLAFIGAVKGLAFALGSLLVAKTLAAVIGGFSTALAAGQVAAAGYAATLGVATRATFSFSAALRATPIGLLVTTLSLLVGVVLELTGAWSALTSLFGSSSDEIDDAADSMNSLQSATLRLAEAQERLRIAETVGNLKEVARATQDSIRAAEEELFNLQRELATGEFSVLDPTAQGLVAEAITLLEEKIEGLKVQLEDTNKEIDLAENGFREAATGADAFSSSVQQALADLEREAEAIQAGNRERRIQNELLRTLKELREAGVDVAPEEEAALERRIRENALLEEKQQILQRLRGEEEAALRTQVLANELLRAGAITQAEFNQILEDTKVKHEEGQAAATAFAEEINNQADILVGIGGPQVTFLQGLERIDELLRAGKLSAEEYAIALRDLEVAFLATQTGAEAGLQLALADITAQLEDVAGTIRTSVVGAFNELQGGIEDFLLTGQLSFEQFFETIRAGLAKLIAQLLLFKALEAASGIPGLGGLGQFITARQAGGSIEPRRPYLVGEEGPEIRTFDRAGRIYPADVTAGILGAGQPQAAPVVQVEPPQVPVTVVNVTSMDDVFSAISSSQGGQAIVNQISRNRQAIRRTLQ